MYEKRAEVSDIRTPSPILSKMIPVELLFCQYDIFMLHI